MSTTSSDIPAQKSDRSFHTSVDLHFSAFVFLVCDFLCWVVGFFYLKLNCFHQFGLICFVLLISPIFSIGIWSSPTSPENFVPGFCWAITQDSINFTPQKFWFIARFTIMKVQKRYESRKQQTTDHKKLFFIH